MSAESDAQHSLDALHARVRQARADAKEIKAMPNREKVVAAQAARVLIIHRRRGIRGATARFLRRLADRLDS